MSCAELRENDFLYFETLLNKVVKYVSVEFGELGLTNEHHKVQALYSLRFTKS